MIQNCKSCDKKFNAGKSINIYCSQKFYGNNKSQLLKGKRPPYMKGFQKGVPSPNKGKKKPPNTKCMQCNKMFGSKPSQKTKFCSRLCCVKQKSPVIKTIRKITSDIRRLRHYRKWRKEILQRDGGRCQKCGSKDRIEVDHFPRTLNSLIVANDIKYSMQARDIKDFWDIANGRLLCRLCHAKEITSKNKNVVIYNSSVCVTGGAGMIGSHLVEELLNRGNKVLVLDNLSAGLRHYIDNRAKFAWFDFRHSYDRLADILKENKIEYVFHLVSLPFIPNCFGDPQPFFDVNANGTMNLLLASEKARVKKVLVYSSAEIYGTREEAIKESDKLNPQSTYGVAKVAAEQLSRMRFIESGLPVVINRQFNVFSWRARHPYIIPEIISQLTNGNKIQLGNIYALRDFLFVEDAVKMAIELLEKGIPGEEYNIGAEKCIQIKELAEKIGKVMGYKEVIIEVDKNRLRPWDIARLQSDNTKLYNTIKYRPETSLEYGLKKVIEKYNQNGHKWDF